MKRIILFFVIVVLSVGISMADTVGIKRFVVKENPFAQNEVAIVATDTLEQIQESVNGKYAFTVNGFEYDLNFQNGTAFYRQKLQKSTFMYVKHKSEAGSYSVLYYIFKRGEKLSPWKISWMWLVVIPLAIVFIGYLFKRLIIVAAIVLIIFIYFNHSNGLNIPTFFESIFDGIKHSVIG